MSEYIKELQTDSIVLDPMMGSGTFLLSAAASGHPAIGYDSDPLAVLIANAAAWVGDDDAVMERAHEIVRLEAGSQFSMADEESQTFANYWFDSVSQRSLAALAAGIAASDPSMHAVLWCGFSRLIITKDAGASRARDVSHSRPHVVRDKASFDPLMRFVAAVRTVLSRRRGLTEEARQRLTIARGDARAMPLEAGTVDAIMTSPPYLTAIDYLRGHRLALVWMGYSVADLRELRGTNIGAERGALDDPQLSAIRAETLSGDLNSRKTRIYNRYLLDLQSLLTEMGRVLKPGGSATFVVANSNHGGTSVRVDDALSFIGSAVGFQESNRRTREIPRSRRYLPPPTLEGSALDLRMGIETILTLTKNRA
ncbi:hypothetical protein ACFXQA_08520 [Microbacterium sp. P07]|uniref:hypothetical protein n=1 Tax=Microbacterium sp. P07 TaxID=3366952 RepID=UPI0037467223